MQVPTTEPQWLKRLRKIDTDVEQIRLPAQVENQDQGLEQDQEWCEVVIAGETRRVRFHDYDRIYQVPGLYEKIFYEELQCCSPSRVVGLLNEVLEDFNEDPESLRVLDVGAGNGMVGEELQACGAEQIVGVDIIEEAKDAAERDRPEVYDDYLVADLTDLSEQVEEALRKPRFNCLTTVAALGFGDIPAAAFLKAFDLCETPGWLAFNIKEDFLRDEDQSGLGAVIQQLSRDEVIQIQAYRRYQHRLSIDGEPLHYVAMVARKLRDVPDHHLAEV